ncbi:hypothetical protein [Virgibacillus proomii]|jgi:hypothetical protein|uniref:hypothetical protein n=1 Tax=Virgibacillus proomii TaxID=84407 RepID=UPI0009858AF9|nr:hypothetical protein [Virgibacillus proomii]
MSLMIAGLAIFTLYIIYKRYIPVRGVNNMERDKLVKLDDGTVLLDLRDYNISHKDKLDQAMPLPLAYLNRHYQDIPACSVILVTSNHVDKNIAARFLINKGFYVKGYYFINNS